MKVLFLDIDGVLNSQESAKKNKSYKVLIPETLDMLNRIIEETGAVIVISSTWRRIYSLDYIKDHLVKYGFKHPNSIIDITPTKTIRGSGRRGDEIQQWITDNPGVEVFAVVDDYVDNMAEVKEELVKTSIEDEMQECHAKELIEKLSK